MRPWITPELKALRGLKVEIDKVKEEDIKEYIKGKKYSKKAKEKAAVINKECDEMVEWGRVKLKQSKTMTAEQKTQLYKDIDNKKQRLKRISKSIQLKEK
ncbi:MAG: hypothetical protein PHR25_05875 [Clostridia bacterium]|nr:hypothetical protein [Clostridia bacterium]